MSNPTSKRWTRTRTIWLLVVLSLAPGIAAAAFREGWEQLPAGVRGAVILISSMLVVAVVSLIITGGPKRNPEDHSPDA